MILYFSGIGFPPERAFKKTNLMMSFIHSAKGKPQKRFRLVYKKRKQERASK